MMAGLLDSIESGFNSLLEPLTSGLDSDPTDIPSTSTRATSTSKTSIITSAARTTSTTSTSSKIPTTSTDRRSTSSSTTSSERTSSSSDSSTISSTTLSTSTTSSSTQSSSTASTSSTTSVQTTPAAPSASPTQAAASTTSANNTGSGISTAGIAVAAVFGVLLIASIIYLTFRFCPAIRNRLDVFYQRRRDQRSYREALDGPAVPKKDDRSSFDSSVRSRADSGPGSIVDLEKTRLSMAAAKELNLPRRPLSSFFALGRNPELQTQAAPAYYPETQRRKPRFSWEQQADIPAQHEVVHQQYVSPHSAGPEDPRGQGLGLGRVSLLRNHSLLRKAGYDVPPPMPGPSMTSAQAEIAVAGAVRIMPGRQEVTVKQMKPASPVRTLEPVRQVQQQEIRRKPVGGVPHVASMAAGKRDQYQSYQQRPVGEARESNYSPPRLNIDIPATPVSQIGVAVSGTPRSAHGYGVGHAR